MDFDAAHRQLRGCYVTMPTMFSDEDLSVDYAAIRRHARFLVDRGLTGGKAVLLTTGAAGDFSTLTVDERIRITAEVVEEVNGRAPVAMGCQTTSTGELVQLAKAAEAIGADYIQVSPPFYFSHTDDDVYEHIAAVTAATSVPVILYNTYWTSASLTTDSLDRLLELPNIVGLKWSAPDNGLMEFEQTVLRYAHRVSIIDNQMRFVTSHMLGARVIELHICNHWPEWGMHMAELLENRRWEEAQAELVRVGLPFMELWADMEQYTAGDGYLDKLCMELVGLGSSRSRPPTRDIRALYRDKARRMLLDTGVPGVADLPE